MELSIFSPDAAGFLKVFDISPVGMAITREDFRFARVNQTFCQIMGYSMDEILPLTFKDFTHPDHISFDLDAYHKLLNGEIDIYKTEKRYIRKDGSIIWGILNLILLPERQDNYRFVLAVVEEITARKEAEDEIVHINEELRRLNAEKDKFFSIIAHDLKSPFQTFINLTRMMEEKYGTISPEKNLAYIRSLGDTAMNLYRLLENLLDWAKLQRGLTTVDPVNVSLQNAVESNLDLLMEQARKKGISIRTDVPEEIAVYADERMVDGILRNLLTNAVKFTPEGGRITIEARHRERKWIETSVSDTGIGISPGMCEQLFRIDVSTGRPGTEGEPSSGLGLILCKEFVERNGGKIRVESTPGRGSVFSFTLPSVNG